MRLLRSWWLGFGAAVALGVSATVAVGQAPPPPLPVYPECTRKPTPQDIEGAKGAHNAATQFYERAEYDKAIRYWNDALAFDCTAVGLLKNIANAYEKLGDRASTVATLETYLKRTGPDPVLEQKVKNLRALMQATPQGTVSAPTATATASAPPTATASAPPTATAPPPVPEGTRPFGYTPWAVVGGGGALAVVGAILLPLGLSDISTAEKACGTSHNGCPAGSPFIDQGNKGRAEGAAGVSLLVVGLAAAGGGLAWQFVFNKPKPSAAAPGQAPPPPKASLSVSPVAGPGQTGVVMKGTF